jgi:hypothetical protein
LKKQLEARTRELAEAQGHLSEALEQQTATSEVLRVISSSPGELEPVFQMMLENATRICEAKFGSLYLGRRGYMNAISATPGASARFMAGAPKTSGRPEAAALSRAWFTPSADCGSSAGRSGCAARLP